MASPSTPPAVATIVADPSATPVTKPLPLTVATDGSRLVHWIEDPGIGLPALSSA
jgi:hypothetical protein